MNANYKQNWSVLQNMNQKKKNAWTFPFGAMEWSVPVPWRYAVCSTNEILLKNLFHSMFHYPSSTRLHSSPKGSQAGKVQQVCLYLPNPALSIGFPLNSVLNALCSRTLSEVFGEEKLHLQSLDRWQHLPEGLGTQFCADVKAMEGLGLWVWRRWRVSDFHTPWASVLFVTCAVSAANQCGSRPDRVQSEGRLGKVVSVYIATALERKSLIQGLGNFLDQGLKWGSECGWRSGSVFNGTSMKQKVWHQFLP